MVVHIVRRADASSMPVVEDPEQLDAGASGVCQECGLPELRRGRPHDCLAHPRPPGMRWVVLVFLLAPLIVVPVLGPAVYLYFSPWLLLIWWAVHQ